ncbi:unnamed protein product, partial [Vitis vinifera]
MGTLFINQIKRQAASFIQEKYRTARLALTDTTPAELLAEEATNCDPIGPDAKTMTIIAEASFDIDDYWRIVDVLHKSKCRLFTIDWKQWRQSYKTLVLLDFLLTHGPEDFAGAFQCDSDVIEELGTFRYVDEKGFDWGILMQKKSEKIIDLLRGGETLKEARFKALKITKEIQGFGNYMASPSSSSSSGSSRTSSFGSYSTSTHLWDCTSIQETGSLLDSEGEEDAKKDGFISGICSKLVGISPTRTNSEKATLRNYSDVGRVTKKKFHRQFSVQ